MVPNLLNCACTCCMLCCINCRDIVQYLTHKSMPAIRHFSSLSDLLPYIDQFELGQLQEQGLFSILVGAFLPSDGSDPNKVCRYHCFNQRTSRTVSAIHYATRLLFCSAHVYAALYYHHIWIILLCIVHVSRVCMASTVPCSTIQRTTTTWPCSL